MKQKDYKNLFNYALNSYKFFQIKYSSEYSVVYHPSYREVEIYDKYYVIHNRINENKLNAGECATNIFNLFLLTKIYYESRNK